MRKIEILAPAGSYSSLVSAVWAGCDAVYIGGSLFGARAFANNLNQEELLKAIDYVHLHDKKIYLTVNTILKDKELKEQLYDYLLPFYLQGLDAVIVQDIGVLSWIHQNFPKLPIHASTQMTLTSEDGVKVFQDLGVTRFVTARELSLAEIKHIREHTSLEIESFVHGALCYSYSGQCFMSSMIGGRSGNRGRCAQPCRKLYEGQYLLSPKDLCALPLIPELIDAGIDSFKIEGRMKRPEYTALTTAMYRKYTDLYIQMGREKYYKYIENHAGNWEEDYNKLLDIYNRGGFTTGYYMQKNGKGMMAMNRPNHVGVLVGKVIHVKGNQAKILLLNKVNPHDTLEFRNKKEEMLYDYTTKESANKGETIVANFKIGLKIEIGNVVYRTKNACLLEEINDKYEEEKKIPLVGVVIAKENKPIAVKIKLADRPNKEIWVEGDLVSKARNQPMTQEKIKKQLNKMGDTCFFFEELNCEIEGDIFIPVGQINELRRNAMLQLEEFILQEYHRLVPEPLPIKKVRKKEKLQYQKKTCFTVAVSNMDQLKEALKYSEIESIYLHIEEFSFDACTRAVSRIIERDKMAYLILPTIFRSETKQYFIESDFDFSRLSGLILKNYEEYTFVKENVFTKTNMPKLILDYNMHILNQEARDYWYQKGIEHFTASYELNYRELKDLGCEDLELIVYGHIPFMTSAQCTLCNLSGCTHKTQILQLHDSNKNKFFVKNMCQYCYNVLYNGRALSLLDQKEELRQLNCYGYRLDFTIETVTEMSEILSSFIDVFCYNKTLSKEQNQITRGHFKRGVD